MKVIDISGYQKDVDIEFIIEHNKDIKGCIFKVGGNDSNYYKDSCSDKHYNICKSFKDVEFGCYYVLSFETLDVDRVVSHILECVDRYSFTMPLYLDIETEYINRYVSDGNNLIDLFEFISNIGRELENNGYFVGIYSSASFFAKNQFCYRYLSRFTWWVAQYEVETCEIECDMWQYGTERFNKVNIDVNEYSEKSGIIEAIKQQGFNCLNVQTVDNEMFLHAIKMYLEGSWNLKQTKKKIKESGVDIDILNQIIRG